MKSLKEIRYWVSKVLALEQAEVKKKVKDRLKAPVKKGQKVGEIQYLLEGEEIASFDVVTDGKVEKRSVFWCLHQALKRVCL